MKKIKIIILLLIASLLFGCGSKEKKLELNEFIGVNDRITKGITSNYFQMASDCEKATIGDKISFFKDNTYSLYLLNIKNYYKVYCAYLSEGDYKTQSVGSVSYLKNAKWLTCDENYEIQSKIGTLMLADVYIVYEAIIVEDLLSNEFINDNVTIVKRYWLKNEESYKVKEEDLLSDTDYLISYYKLDSYEHEFIPDSLLEYYGNIMRNDNENNKNIYIEWLIRDSIGNIRESLGDELNPYKDYFIPYLIINGWFETRYNFFEIKIEVQYSTISLDDYLKIIRNLMNEK